MFLIIDEVGQPVKAQKLTAEDHEAWEEGLLEILDISHPKTPLMYAGNSSWVPVPESYGRE